MSEDFQRAYKIARSKFRDEEWFLLSISAQTQAIYAALRDLDAERVAACKAEEAAKKTT